MCDQIVVPIRAGGCAALGCDDHQSITIGCICQGIDAVLATFGSCRCDQQELSSGERSTNLASVSVELLNNLAIPFIIFRHRSSSLSMPVASTNNVRVRGLFQHAGKFETSCFASYLSFVSYL